MLRSKQIAKGNYFVMDLECLNVMLTKCTLSLLLPWFLHPISQQLWEAIYCVCFLTMACSLSTKRCMPFHIHSQFLANNLSICDYPSKRIGYSLELSITCAAFLYLSESQHSSKRCDNVFKVNKTLSLCHATNWSRVWRGMHLFVDNEHAIVWKHTMRLINRFSMGNHDGFSDSGSTE